MFKLFSRKPKPVYRYVVNNTASLEYSFSSNYKNGYPEGRIQWDHNDEWETNYKPWDSYYGNQWRALKLPIQDNKHNITCNYGNYEVSFLLVQNYIYL